MTCFEQTTIIIALIISFFVAVGTIGLAFFAFRQIREVNNEYKRKQLNEILEWAKSAINWKFTEEYTDKVRIHPNNGLSYISHFLSAVNHC